EWFEKDYYQTLGVPKNAAQDEIKKAYRKLAQKHHPDANAGNKESEERFKEISAAYDVVGNEEKRKQYDEVREMAASGVGGFPGGFPGGATPGGGGVRDQNVNVGDVSDIGDLGDLFSIFTGGGARGRRAGRQPSRGADLETRVRISFDEAMEGTT